jgi:hypothetical protein
MDTSRLVDATLSISMSAEKPYSKDVVGCEQSDYAVVAA